MHGGESTCWCTRTYGAEVLFLAGCVITNHSSYYCRIALGTVCQNHVSPRSSWDDNYIVTGSLAFSFTRTQLQVQGDRVNWFRSPSGLPQLLYPWLLYSTLRMRESMQVSVHTVDHALCQLAYMYYYGNFVSFQHAEFCIILLYMENMTMTIHKND